jgi:alkyldihydroxyacetonephosphate synthase
MTRHETAIPAGRRQRKFWGWGYTDQGLNPQERDFILSIAKARGGDLSESPISPPEVKEFDLAKPRVRAPETLSHLITDDLEERLVHTYGKSYADSVRMFLRQASHPPDLVAFPRTEQDVADLLDWAERAGAAVVPFGGGTSVCGGVETNVGGEYPATLSIDLTAMDKILEIDKTSRAARMQAGILGPDLEAGLKPHGLTLRHFPQSFEFSTLGGWIASRSGGHYASLYTHIDDFVEATRTVTPSGVIETRRLPGSGAGPSADRMIIGSEGILGIITEAWMRLQDRPVFRGSAAVSFADLTAGAEAVRALSQSALYPTNCRLIDASEALTAGGSRIMVGSTIRTPYCALWVVHQKRKQVENTARVQQEVGAMPSCGPLIIGS